MHILHCMYDTLVAKSYSRPSVIQPPMSFLFLDSIQITESYVVSYKYMCTVVPVQDIINTSYSYCVGKYSVSGNSFTDCILLVINCNHLSIAQASSFIQMLRYTDATPTFITEELCVVTYVQLS